ncbi:hypothetical protein VTN96DRAFT_8549 [Rasamsonia emersonii]|uniref:Peptidase A1 domain-containing protein n=1 Tax=Rasamsonia emersonii (strain ATCC 16479 / CBS 393.64 / IMI 116815) TaxID=1408163 RepID=A0A0F4YQ47_RASE3|nr:hypothetical protein T310_5779 [Rasamsonia emersonii CBS 393.64]KKA20210.1 hypothetical protein T310_5779 [Rasamsonia emersonii CBS 393.64]
MARRFFAIAVCGLAHLIYAQDTLSSATTSSTSMNTVPASASATPTDAAWVIPLVGPTNDSSSPWGANISLNGKPSPALVPIVVGNGSQSSGSESSSSVATFANAVPPSGSGDQLLWMASGSTELVLGQNSSLSFLHRDSSTNETLPTVPFGLNLGYAGKWNGSLVFGGSYDENRIYWQMSWAIIPETSNGQGTFLSTGKQTIGSVALRLYEYQPDLSPPPNFDGYPFGTSMDAGIVAQAPAILDFSSEELVLPSQAWCGRNITLEFNDDVKNMSGGWFTPFKIPILDELTSSPGRCSGPKDTNNSTPPMILGKPFFQSTYLYVDTNGDVYYSAVNRWDLPPNPVPFNASAFLKPPSPPPSATQSPRPTHSLSAGDKIVGPIGEGSIGALAGLVTVFLCAFLFL